MRGYLRLIKLRKLIRTPEFGLRVVFGCVLEQDTKYPGNIGSVRILLVAS